MLNINDNIKEICSITGFKSYFLYF